MRRVAAFVTIALVAVCLAPVAASAAGERTLSLSASKFDFSAEPGQKGVGEVFVINEGDTPVSVKVYTANQLISEQGKASYVVPAIDSNPLTSPASWVLVKLPPNAKSSGNIPYVDLGPRERAPIRFEVTVPDGATPGDRQAILFFELFTPQDALQGGATGINARLGARIKTRVSGEFIEKLEVRPFTMPAYVIGASPSYSMTVRNGGNLDQRIEAKLLVLDRSGNERSSAVVATDAPVYAGTVVTRDGVLALPNPSIGPTHVKLVVQYTGESGVAKSIEEDRTVWVIPVWLLIVCIVALAVFVLLVVWVAASKVTARSIKRHASGSDEQSA